ncbi:MAG: DUF2721 domain-containing protein [Clostridia bacterium]|nr:DUF2721 domain-containing protein [Clostridia bacterium]
MDINITTPALLFSAITLLMLAYTNRFLAIAALVRQFHTAYKEKPDERVYKQIQNFRKRLKIIKNMQLFSVISFFLCVLCMFLIFANKIHAANIVFAVSLVLLMLSLFLSIIEIYISVDALEVELSDLESIQKET